MVGREGVVCARGDGLTVLHGASDTKYSISIQRTIIYNSVSFYGQQEEST